MVVPIDDKLREILKKWWIHYGIPEFPFQVKRSFMVFEKDFPVCASFCWVEDCNVIGWLAYVTMNPEARTEVRGRAFKEMLAAVEQSLKEEGVRLLIAPANNPSLLARLLKYGFEAADCDVVHLIKKI